MCGQPSGKDKYAVVNVLFYLYVCVFVHVSCKQNKSKQKRNGFKWNLPFWWKHASKKGVIFCQNWTVHCTAMCTFCTLFLLEFLLAIDRVKEALTEPNQNRALTLSLLTHIHRVKNLYACVTRSNSSKNGTWFHASLLLSLPYKRNRKKRIATHTTGKR